MSSTGQLPRLSRLVVTLRDELEICDRALLSYERGVLDSNELHESLKARSPMSLDAVHNARHLINDLLQDLEAAPGAGTTSDKSNRSRRVITESEGRSDSNVSSRSVSTLNNTNGLAIDTNSSPDW